jgi:hypothetical protein
MGTYEQAGYEVYRPPKAKFREQDIFSLFDLLAFGHGRLEAVQVKSNRARGIRQWVRDARTYEEHIQDLRVRFVVRYEDQGLKMFTTDTEGYQVTYDGREIDETPAASAMEVLQE